jgi:DNA-directed RNA polymerase specialized sigma24 family protein
MKPDEIAKKMGKTVGAIYSLRFNALNDLRKILSRNRDNLNE